ncbi:MAG: 2Fe-2S iron-sulfur cluster binding domain-containing protein, partial [Euryarchaeota archaeon]|nr:2Fe-2S iron-sulfur cluster binding domain-containing protein [Euryarchaeota archaeon]
MSSTVVFQPYGRSTEVEEECTLLEAARRAGVEIESICGGEQSCGKCRVRVIEGSEHLSAAEAEELKLLGRALEQGMRLACSARVLGGRVVVHVPEESQPKHAARKGLSMREVELEPAVRCHTLRIPQPSLQDQRDDWSRVAEALTALGIPEPEPEVEVLRRLSSELRRGGWEVSICLWQDRAVAVEAGRMQPLGVAVDLGTTTVAGYLVELESGEVLATSAMLNPQVRFGEDVMSRVSHAMQGWEKAEELRRCAASAVSELVAELCRRAGREPEHVVELVIVGNTAMHHLLLGLPVAQLALSPYVPAVARGLSVSAGELGIGGTSPACRVYLPPVQAGFVGSDCTAVLVALEPEKSQEVQLIVDIGTNGEIVLGSCER